MNITDEPTVKDVLDRAAESIKGGEIDQGRQDLEWVLTQEPENVLAWLWMSRCFKDSGRKLKCFQRVLAIDPTNQHAIKGMKQYGERKPAGQEFVPEPTNGRGAPAAQAIAISSPTRVVEIPQLVGIVGALLIMAGVLVPIVQVPLLGGLSYLDFGYIETGFLILLGVATAVALVLKRYELCWSTGLAAAGLFLATMGVILYLIISLRSATNELGDGLAGEIADAIAMSFGPDWGWLVLILGVGLVLATPIVWRPARSARKAVLIGVLLAVVLPLTSFIYRRYVSSSGLDTLGNGEGSSGGLLGDSGTMATRNLLKEDLIPAGELISYEYGELQILQMHDPAGFLIEESLSFDHDGTDPVPGTRFVAVEFEFACAQTEIVCDSIPSASLELLLEDGRRVDDDWSITDADRLGSEEVVAGGSVAGWRVFMVPDASTIKGVVIDPFSGREQLAGLPLAMDGYEIEHAWRPGEGSSDAQIVPALRQDLRAEGFDVGYVFRGRTDEGTFLSVEICKDTDYYFDESDALDDHRQILLDVADYWRTYGAGGRMLLITVNDCSSFTISKVAFGLEGGELDRWLRGDLTDELLLGEARILID